MTTDETTAVHRYRYLRGEARIYRWQALDDVRRARRATPERREQLRARAAAQNALASIEYARALDTLADVAPADFLLPLLPLLPGGAASMTDTPNA